MSAFHLQRSLPFNATLDCAVCNQTAAMGGNFSDAPDLYVPGDGSLWLRATVATVYFAVSAVGLAGNGAVLFLLRARGGAGGVAGAINFFVLNLAAADLLSSAAAALWAADAALDYRWPFGGAACKAASFLTSLNLFGSVLFLAAMSVARYRGVARSSAALRPGAGAGLLAACPRGAGPARLAAALIWAGSALAAAPRAAYAEVADVAGDPVCLLRFPDGTFWLGLHHLLRVALGFLLPYAVILLSYLLLLRFLSNHGDPGRRRRARVTRSVATVILAFCVCWLPNNVLTVWGLLVHLDAVGWSPAFYAAHTYAFPLASCLAQANGCLNPVLYCLVHREHRRALRGLLRGARPAAGPRGVALPLHGLGDRSGVASSLGPPPSTCLTRGPGPESSSPISN